MTMTEGVAESSPASSSPVVHADERIAHRGPMRRWLISPEIGALIGAVIVWSFFWGNGRTFGEADTTLNWLDVAAPTGIMATAVALLMIGGEFDLSSGVITGATAVQIGLFSQHFMGDGVNIGWAIGGCFLAAGAVGWFNGFMVNKTGLPSFIITLSSFFVLRGVILVMSKRLSGKVQVAEILKARGAAGFKNWIAHEWRFTEFAARDKLFLGLVIVGAAAFFYGLLEQSFIRAHTVHGPSAVAAIVGLALAVAGFVGIHATDGVGNNAIYSTIAGVGIVVSLVGLARFRWMHRRHHPGASTLPRAAAARLGLGLAGVVAACLAHIPFDRHQRDEVLSWTSPALRPIVLIGVGLIGVAFAVKTTAPALRGNKTVAGVLRLVAFAAYCGLLLTTMAASFLQLTTVQAFRTIIMLVLAGGGVILMIVSRGIAGKVSARWQLIIGATTVIAVLVLAFVVRADAGAPRFRTGMFSAFILGAILIATNTALEYVMEKRTVADVGADHLGRRLQLLGSSLAGIGLIVRLVWTNLTPEHAKAVKAAGGSVGQNVLRETVVWWLLVAIGGAYVLTKTRWGNWIFAVGGNKEAARAIGVPANKVKIVLFVVVSLCGALSGTLIALRYGTVQANSGTGLEFEYIIAAVVGGCLMTGGYGSVIGASLGASILAMSTVGVQTVKEWNSDGRFAFLGGVLLLAVLVNDFIRKKAQEAR